MTLRSALAPSTMNSRQTVGRARARSDCRSAPGRRRYFRRPLDQAKRMPIAIAINSEGGDQHQVVANMQAIDLDNQQVDFG